MNDARPFHFKHFSLYHHRSTMKVGTDAILLGRWVEVKPTDVVLDIGTGCGLLPLMLSQKGVAQVNAVDIDKASIEEATVNFEASQWREHLNAYCADIVDYQPDKKHDLIVSNPPFFNHFSKCDSERKSRARHNDMTLSHEALCASVCRLLKPDGRLALVLPALESVDFLKVAEKFGLFLHRTLNIIPTVGKPCNRVNLELRFDKSESPIIESIQLRNMDGSFSPECKAFLNEFYLG